MHSTSPIIIEPTEEHKCSVVWLHGLGANANDFYSLLPVLPIADKSAYRWIFPNAPVMPVSINGGMPMPSWFDILSLSPNFRANEEDIKVTCDYVHSLIAQEYSQLALEDKQLIHLVGFSQGGVIALQAGITALANGWVKKLFILGLSCCHPSLKEVLNQLSQEQIDRLQAGLQVYLMHGEEDEVIDINLGKQSVTILQEFGLTVRWKSYPMAHQVCQQQLFDIADFLSVP